MNPTTTSKPATKYPVKYRGYNISPDTYFTTLFQFVHKGYDGSEDHRYGRALGSVEAAKKAIDEQIRESIKYKIKFQGEYIELTVSVRGFIRNKYTIDNDGKLFEAWCIENGHARPEHEKEFDPDDEDGYGYSISHDTAACIADADLITEYCLEQIKSDFL